MAVELLTAMVDQSTLPTYRECTHEAWSVPLKNTVRHTVETAVLRQVCIVKGAVTALDELPLVFTGENLTVYDLSYVDKVSRGRAGSAVSDPEVLNDPNRGCRNGVRTLSLTVRRSTGCRFTRQQLPVPLRPFSDETGAAKTQAFGHSCFEPVH